MVFSKNKHFVTLALLFLSLYASNCAHLSTYSYATNGTTIQNSLWSASYSYRTTPSRHLFIVICPIAEVGVEYGGYGFSVIGSNERLDPTAFVVFSFFGTLLFFFGVTTIFMICRSFLKKLASVKQSECHVVPHGDASRSTTRNYRRKIHGKSRTTASSLIFDQMIEHILRINRIHRQLQGHLKISGSGKTTFLRFVVWINGIPVFQLKVHSGYTGAHLDEDIRHVLCQACCKKKYIIFSHGIVASPTKLPGPLVSAADLSKNQEMITANKNHMAMKTLKVLQVVILLVSAFFFISQDKVIS